MAQNSPSFNPTRHYINQKELQRRRAASRTLIITLTIGFGIGLMILWGTNAMTTIGAVAAFALLMAVLRSLALRPFKSFSKTTVTCFSDRLEIQGTLVTTLRYSDIHALRLLRTSTGGIRDVSITMNNGYVVTIDALEDFEQFWQQLKSSASAPVRESREPLNYDHPLFYVFLGLIVGFCVPLIVRLTTSLSATSAQLLGIVFAIFVLLLAGYFLWRKPLLHRYGKLALKGDVGFGLLLVLGGIALLVFL